VSDETLGELTWELVRAAKNAEGALTDAEENRWADRIDALRKKILRFEEDTKRLNKLISCQMAVCHDSEAGGEFWRVTTVGGDEFDRTDLRDALDAARRVQKGES